MVDVAQNEQRTTREVMRSLGALLDDLEAGTLAKVVVLGRSGLRGVLLSVAEYDRLRGGGA